MILKDLSETIGVSGDESAVRKVVLGAIKDHVAHLQIDSMGNLIARKSGDGTQPLRVMIAAHMDEIGFMITGYDSNGLLRFTNVGGVDARLLPGLRVVVGQDALPGVILWPPIHRNRDQNTRQIKDLRIDIGVTSKEAAEKKAPVGSRATFASHFAELGETTLRGKAFDDRVGCSLLVDVVQGGPYPVDVIAAFTVQEEIGLRGARVAAQRVQPDVALVLEGTTAHDVPKADADPDDPNTPNPATRLGHGPALTVMDRSMITPPHLLKFIRQKADAAGIAYQLKTALGGGTDGGQIHLSNSGVPTAVISMPCRYIHAPTAYLDRRDYDQALALIKAVLGAITPDVIRQP